MSGIDFLKNRVCLNVLVKDKDNAKEVLEASEGHVLMGLLSKDYPDNDTAIKDMSDYKELFENKISIGLGAGDPSYANRVKDISKSVIPLHINQIFTSVGATREAVGDIPWINSLVSPSGKAGYVVISTGHLSEKEEKAIVNTKTAIAMCKEMGADSLKFFPMHDTKTLEDKKAVAKACAEMDFALEPTGGIDLDNYEVILKTILNEGVNKIIPHVYSSIIDKTTGKTKTDDITKLLNITKRLLG